MNDFEDAKAALLDQAYNLDLLKREMDESLKEVVSKKGIRKYVSMHIKEFVREQKDSEGLGMLLIYLLRYYII